MALIKCADCGREVSDKATACPQCGAPIPAAALPVTATPVATQAPIAAPATKRGVRAVTLVLLLLLIGIAYFAFKVIYGGSSVRSAVTGPETIFSEQVSLKEGDARGYGFTIPMQRRIEVVVNAAPKPVNVMLMNDSEWAKYNKARGKLFGGEYTYRQALSAQSVLQMKESEMLPAGTWRVVVERPTESLFGGKSTAATVKIIAY